MDPRRVGSDIRLLRRQRGWAQARLAAAAGVSACAVHRIEGGHPDAVLAGTLTRVVTALDGHLSVRVLWHGEGLDRLRDRRHAALVERTDLNGRGPASPRSGERRQPDADPRRPGADGGPAPTGARAGDGSPTAARRPS